MTSNLLLANKTKRKDYFFAEFEELVSSAQSAGDSSG